MVENPGCSLQYTFRRIRKKKLGSAHEQFGYFVGQIGIDTKLFLHDLELWQLQQISDNFSKRSIPGWNQARFVSWIIARINGSKVESPEELHEFPWERAERELEEHSSENMESLHDLVEECKRENQEDSKRNNV